MEKEMKKTYTVWNVPTEGDYVIFNDEWCGYDPYEEFEVEEGEVWYGTSILDISLDPKNIKDIENIEYYDQGELMEILENMGNQKLMDLVKNTLGEEGIERIYLNYYLHTSFDKCEKEYVADGNFGSEYTIYVDWCGVISFEAEIKFKFWIENGCINHSVVWKFKNE